MSDDETGVCLQTLRSQGATSVTVELLREVFCSRCRQPKCIHSALLKGLWLQRMQTQEDKLLYNPVFADESHPLAGKHEFKSMIREAIRLNIAERRGDWEIPSDEEVDGYVSQQVGNMVRSPEEPPESEPPKKDLGIIDMKPPPGFMSMEPPEKKVPHPGDIQVFSNTETPIEGVMVDGSPATASQDPRSTGWKTVLPSSSTETVLSPGSNKVTVTGEKDD